MSIASHALRTLPLLLAAGCASAPAAPAPGAGAAPGSAAGAAYLGQLPPLLDRNLFFDDPQTSGAQISPDGRFISFVRPYRNVRNIWVKGVDEPFDAARPLTADTARPVAQYFWSEDGRFVLYVQDKGGDENYHVYAVDPTLAPEAGTGVPPARDLTPLPNVRAFIYAVPEATPDEIIIGLNDRDPALHDVYRLRLSTGERSLLIRNESNVAGWVPDLTGTIRLAWRQRPDGGSEMLRVEDGQLGEAIYSCAFEETCQPYRFHRDGQRVYIVSDRGDVDLSRLMLLDVATGQATLVEADPEKEVDFAAPIFSDRTEELVATVYIGDRLRIYPRDQEFGRILADLRSKLPDGELGFSSTTEDERLWVVSVARDVAPASVYLYDRTDGSVEKLYDSRPELPTEHLAEMRPIRYQARDGRSIPAYLTIPKGVQARGLPTVIFPHGGPWARDLWGYNATAQFLANRGYAVLQPNFRGSTGYGKAFLNAGNMEWGTGAMQHDISDGVLHLIREGIADSTRMAIMGGSYGGYATLAGLTFTPDLYAAGVSIVGPSNIITLINSFPAYWGPVIKIFTMRAGDPNVPEQAERLRSQSPFFHATNIRAPLLVIQGANDPRVKQAESDQIVVALRDLGRGVEYIVAPDEGHGFAGRENRLAMYARIEEFLAQHLGGRYQPDMPDDIRERLRAISVDVATVTLPPPSTAADAARIAPLPAVDAAALAPASASYRTTLTMGGREMVIESENSLRREDVDGRAAWRLESTMTGAMGEGSDVWYLDATSLRPIRRSVSQGPARIEVEYGDTIRGSITVGAQEIPVTGTTTAPVFGDQAALDLVLTALPLAEGYRTTLRTFEVGAQQRQRLWSLHVEGAESVTVPGGTFDTWKTVVSPLDGEGGAQTLWITRTTPRLIVRGEAELPAAAGGGTATTVLLSTEAGT
ncbi:MAG TPA: prolyl oligopeptidase family serine peptidase [Longimicrobiales bacterium]|nr:prolyl oligopeptidase family serine peptidase [Longimicrobiales bacterium]